MDVFNFKDKKYIFIQYIELIVGTILMSIGVALFLLPNKLSTGGFTGVGTIFYYLFNLNIGIVILVLNIPLFIISYFKIGRRFFLKSIIGTFLLSILVDYLEQFKPITDDKFLGCIFGGIIIGIGNSLIFRSNGSTGGTEILTAIIKAYKPMFRTSNIVRVFDAIVVAINVIVFKQIEIGLYSAIAIYMSTKMIDLIFEGTNFTKMIFIISSKYTEIAKEIELQEIRGITGIYAKGMYKNEDKLMLLCVVSRNEVIEIRQIVHKIDQKAFIIIANTREVFGEGFKNEKI